MPKAELIGLGEVRTSVFYRRLAAETLGSALLVIFGCGSAMTVNEPIGPSVITIAVAFGLTVATVRKWINSLLWSQAQQLPILVTCFINGYIFRVGQLMNRQDQVL